MIQTLLFKSFESSCVETIHRFHMRSADLHELRIDERAAHWASAALVLIHITSVITKQDETEQLNACLFPSSAVKTHRGTTLLESQFSPPSSQHAFSTSSKKLHTPDKYSMHGRHHTHGRLVKLWAHHSKLWFEHTAPQLPGG